MVFSENRFPSRIKSGTGIFGIMLQRGARMTPEENNLLCRVEGDAPMGQIMRRHWIAACLAEEVAEPLHEAREVRLFPALALAEQDPIVARVWERNFKR